MGKSPTIYDVSRKARVSAATVSRVLNDPGKVSMNTREAVESAIKELDYKPLLEVRLRSVRDIPKICVCAPHFTASSYVQRLRGIAQTLAGRDYELQVYSVTSKSQLDRFIETIEMRAVDGVIFLSLLLTDEQIMKLNEAGVESVLVEYTSSLTNCVQIDSNEGGRLAARYLIERGYTEFGFLGEPANWDYCIHSFTPRFEGYRSELEKNGFELKKEFTYSMQMDIKVVRDHFDTIFKSGKYPRALFAAADIMGFGVQQAARDFDVRIPEDIAIIGFDDIDFSDVANLTTICQHLDESGELAAEILMSRLHDRSKAIQQVKLSLNLVEREST